MELALASLLGVDAIGVIAADEPAIPDADAATSLAVEQARARLARAQAVAATAGSAWGADVRGGLAFQRDLEDRESVGTSIELALPMFRRESEIAAVHADVEAIRAELAEAERATRLAARQACASAERARELQRLAAAGSDAAAQARERIEHAASIGEASRAEVHGARAAEWSARSDAARRRIALATAIAELESLAAPPAHHAESTDLDRRNPHAATSRMESQP
jgi:outer membrane protein TolC